MKSFTDQVRDWAALKPSDEKYDYGSTDDCALCRFLKEMGYTDTPSVGGDYWRAGVSLSDPPVGIDERVRGALVNIPHTYGALAERLSA